MANSQNKSATYEVSRRQGRGRWFESIIGDFMKIVFGQKLGVPDCIYMVRWIIDFKWFSIRLHHWLKSDDLRHMHDHPWDFYSLVLWGSIIDRTESGDEQRNWLSLRKFKAEHRHAAVINKPCWTLLFCGREKRVWGYWVDGKFRKRNKYYYENGHHNPCQ